MGLNDKVNTSESTAGTSTSTTTASQWQTYRCPSAQQGWECPRCGRINAPWVSHCDCGRSYWTITSSPDWTYRPDWWKEVTCNPDTQWKVPSSFCSTDSSKRDPNVSTTVWSSTMQPIEGGSDYWDEVNKIWTNTPDVSNSTTSENSPWNKYYTLTSQKIDDLQFQINNLKETK